MSGIISNAIGDLRRSAEIIQAAIKYGFGPTLSRAKLLEKFGVSGAEAKESSGTPAPVRFRMMIDSLGPTFVKFGQILSTRPDILPKEWIEELSRLQDDVSPMPFSHFSTELQKGLGKNASDLFSSVDETPLASASIAQVHRAVTLDGRQVVLKVRRPEIRERVRADMDILRYLAIALQATVEEAGIYNPEGIVVEFEKTINAEMDFRVEAHNIERFAENFAGSQSLVVPTLLPELCAENVLCMEYIDGIKITEVGDNFDRDTLARNLLEAAFKQVYEDGFFHADPHPGNILALSDNRIALLDFGQVGDLTKMQKELIISLSLAIALRDSESIARIIYRSAKSEKRIKLARLRIDIENMLDKYIDMDISSVKTGTLLAELVEVAAREQLRLPPEYTMLAKGSVTIEGLVRTLAPNLNIGMTIKPFAQKLLAGRYAADSFPEALLKFGMRLYSLMQDIPLQLDQVVSDIEEGRFNVHITGEDIGKAAKNIRHAAFTLGGAIVSGALLVGGFVCIAAGKDAAGWTGLISGSILAILSVMWHLASGIKFKKFRLTKLKDRN